MTSGLRRALSYKLNDGALDQLRIHRVPEQLVARLSALKDRTFASRSEFEEAVAQTVGNDADAHRQVIVREARVLNRGRVARVANAEWRARVAGSRFVLPLWSYVWLHPVMFTIRFKFRWWRFSLLRRLAGQRAVKQTFNPNEAGFDHNRKQMLSFLEGHRNRTEAIINVLRCVEGLETDNARVLCVGPRNEAEILLLNLYGFPLKNIKAIDLFSYSPAIEVMDMNDIRYPDSQFDVYYSSAVIKYSPDIRRTVSEALRVTKRGGLMVFGFMYGPTTDLIPKGSELSGGIDELLGLFGEHVDHVYWHENFRYSEDESRAAVIFRVR